MAKSPKAKSEKPVIRKSVEIIKVSSDVDEVVCNGGGGALGHPQVWYGFDGLESVSCHYCGRKFVKKTS